ncbi:DNA-binding transcriptional regulator, MarR family [Microbacterium sp. ru370.1]|uniref:MarR family winged helix-turn-helix transcriptional regulator n=1 Tax=unclassified Microbacterium TaxID=2609290 RepID=UPI000888D45C|nr:MULTISPECIES: MarR family transcriptional regulator [unclassified Microbacterium]SDP02532.1 DNA-binding transcriptional regulator, MarR family [Microbacterium sp. ru370.1]SIT91873.1 DNA-binding transcriptional regulator, MarR family [Microbacterium sp. RU1D]
MTAPDRVDAIAEQWRAERADLDVAPMQVIGRLHRLADHLREEVIAEYRRHGLGEGEFDILAALRRAGEPFAAAPGELARHTMVTTGAVTKRVDRLVASGLVVRDADADDGRGRVIRLTPAGRRVIDEAFAAHLANEERLLAGLAPAQRHRLETLLRAWGDALGV